MAFKQGDRRDPLLKHGRPGPVDDAQQGAIADRKFLCVPLVALTTLNSFWAQCWILFVVAKWHAWSQRARCTPPYPDIIPSWTGPHPPFDPPSCRRRSRTACLGDLYHCLHAMTPRMRTLVAASGGTRESSTAGLPRNGRVVTRPFHEYSVSKHVFGYESWHTCTEAIYQTIPTQTHWHDRLTLVPILEKK